MPGAVIRRHTSTGSVSKLSSLLDNRTVLNTCPASGTQVHINAAGTLPDPDREISLRPLNRFQVCISD